MKAVTELYDNGIDIEEYVICEWFNIEWPNNFNLLYSAQYADYSWGDVLIVFEVDGNIFINRGDEWFPEQCDEALQEMMDFESLCLK